MSELQQVRKALSLENIVDTLHESVCKKRRMTSLGVVKCFCGASEADMKAGRAIRKLVLDATRKESPNE